MDQTKDTLLEAYERLPAKIQAVIADAETEKKVLAIGEQEQLHVDQLGQLADETGLVLLGIAPPTEFINHLQTRLGIEKTKAQSLAQAINERVFLPIQDALKTLSATPAPEEKTEKVFSLPKKIWDEDPYIEKP